MVKSPEASLSEKYSGCEIIKQIWLTELSQFIVEGNKNAWASGHGEIDATRLHHKRFIYEKGPWILDDEYKGYFAAPGITTISYKKHPVWCMFYGGEGQNSNRDKLAPETFSFLKEALQHVEPNLPFRGPKEYKRESQNLKWRYNFILIEGDIKNFNAKEIIYYQYSKTMPSPEIVFSQSIMGSLVFDKTPTNKRIYPWEL